MCVTQMKTSNNFLLGNILQIYAIKLCHFSDQFLVLLTFLCQICHIQHMLLTHADDWCVHSCTQKSINFFSPTHLAHCCNCFHSQVQQQCTQMLPGRQMEVIQNISLTKSVCRYGSMGLLLV
jgi:hypothetical protein